MFYFCFIYIKISIKNKNIFISFFKQIDIPYIIINYFIDSKYYNSSLTITIIETSNYVLSTHTCAHAHTYNVLTAIAARLPIAPTPRRLNIAEPTIVPMPISDCVKNVEMTFTKNSGHEVATDMKVAAATF